MDAIQLLATWFQQAQRVVAFTGAGISTESGIPDFRSPGGIWATSQPVYFHDFLADEDARREYWRQKCIAHKDFMQAKPNAGHQVLAQLEACGKLQAVITQNIDGLHQDAGSRHVLELHGSARWISCLECHTLYDPDPLVAEFLTVHTIPNCQSCGGLLKHATVSFGQQLPEAVLEESIELSQQADLFLAIGSSLVVEPAASMPRLAKRNGAKLVILNRDPTPQDSTADLLFPDGIGTTLSALWLLIAPK